MSSNDPVDGVGAGSLVVDAGVCGIVPVAGAGVAVGVERASCVITRLPAGGASPGVAMQDAIHKLNARVIKPRTFMRGIVSRKACREYRANDPTLQYPDPAFRFFKGKNYFPIWELDGTLCQYSKIKQRAHTK